MRVLAILKPDLKFLYHNRYTDTFFFAVHRTVFSEYFKLNKINCHNLS